MELKISFDNLFIMTSSSIPANFIVYVGFDSRNFGQKMAYEVCRRSIIRHASRPVEVRQLTLPTFQASGLYNRDDNTGSTEFTYTRFLVPYLNNYQGWALFCDSDFLWTDDVWKIFDDLEDLSKAVYCVQHEIKSTGGLKMNGLKQANYPRKNWSSLMLFNCTLCKNLTPEAVNSQTPAWLHRMQWLDDNQIGSVSHSYNYLVGYYSDHDYSNLPKAIHYTEGGPWHPGYETTEFGDLWLAYVSLEEADEIFKEREKLRQEMREKYDEEELNRERDVTKCQL